MKVKEFLIALSHNNQSEHKSTPNTVSEFVALNLITQFAEINYSCGTSYL